MEKPPAASSLPCFAGSRWLPLAVTVLLILALMLLLLESLNRVQAESERLMLELTLRNMNLGLQAAKGHALARGREHEIHGWVGQNPLGLLDGELKGYQGNCQAGVRGPEPGQWCFDQVRGVLVYATRSAGYVRDRNGVPMPRLEWRVMVPAGAAGGAGGLLALRVEPLEPPVWEIPGLMPWSRS